MAGAGRAQRVVVVTGGGAGIGAAIAEELGRQGAYVVTMDPLVTVDGSERLVSSEPTTAQRIVRAGGSARASDASVADAEAVRALFKELVADFGALDAVVNVAGISRPTDFGSGADADWADVLDVHLGGYLNVLGAALPLMITAGHGRILGVTSGSGWRQANAGAYGCAKRAVAALTWQIGHALPPGVTVNALSPIALTRMVTGGLPVPSAAALQAGNSGATGGLSLAAMPAAESLGPVGSYLASEDFGWCTGQVVFSSGSEVSLITPPRLLEAVRTDAAVPLGRVLDTVLPGAFAPAEAAQATNGGSNPRFGAVFDDSSEVSVAPSADPQTCVIVSDDADWAEGIAHALARRGADCIGVGAWRGGGRPAVDLPGDTPARAELLQRLAHDESPIDAVIVALAAAGEGSGAATGSWQQILAEHDETADGIATDAGWVRAAADYAARTDRPVRVITLSDATTAGGLSRAQSATQLARAAHIAAPDRIDAFAVSVEAADASVRQSAAELAAHLACVPTAGALSGAELVAATGWLGLRRHPGPSATISFGGPAIPDWLDRALQSMVVGHAI